MSLFLQEFDLILSTNLLPWNHFVTPGKGNNSQLFLVDMVVKNRTLKA